METTGVATRPWTEADSVLKAANILIEDMTKDMNRGTQTSGSFGFGFRSSSNPWKGQITISGVENGFIIKRDLGTEVVAKNSGEVAAFFIANEEDLKAFLLNFDKHTVLGLLGITTSGTATVQAKKKKGKKNAY